MEDFVNKVTASQVMTRDVLSARPDWSVDQLVEFLTEHGISGAPVLSEHDEPIGVVSLTDVARNGAITERSAEAPDYYRHGLEQIVGRDQLAAFRVEVESETTVADIMTPVLFSVDQDASVQEVAGAMVTGRIHRVLVTQAKKVVGIISSMDLLPLVRDM